MKKTILITALLLIVALMLTGCKSKEEKAAEMIGQQFEKMAEIEGKLMRGEITEEEAEKMFEKMVPTGAVPQRDMPKGLPRWAKNLGLSEPKGMELDRPNSYETAIGNQYETFDSVDLVYRGDFETAKSEAARIAEGADMPMVKLFGMLVDYEDLVQYGNAMGDAYSEDLEYTIIIEASIEEGEGKLNIIVTNQAQMMESAEELQKMMEGVQ